MDTVNNIRRARNLLSYFDKREVIDTLIKEGIKPCDAYLIVVAAKVSLEMLYN